MRRPAFPYQASTRGPGFLNAPPERAGAAFAAAWCCLRAPCAGWRVRRSSRR